MYSKQEFYQDYLGIIRVCTPEYHQSYHLGRMVGSIPTVEQSTEDLIEALFSNYHLLPETEKHSFHGFVNGLANLRGFIHG